MAYDRFVDIAYEMAGKLSPADIKYQELKKLIREQQLYFKTEQTLDTETDHIYHMIYED